MTVTGLVLGLFVLYDLFPWLTARLRCCRLLLTGSNGHHWIALAYLIQQSLISAFQWNKCHPRIVVGIVSIWSKNYSNYTYSHLFKHSDIDECFSDNGGCHHNCHNSDGSHTCSCNDGYRFNSNGYTCEGRLRGHFQTIWKNQHHYDIKSWTPPPLLSIMANVADCHTWNWIQWQIYM